MLSAQMWPGDWARAMGRVGEKKAWRGVMGGVGGWGVGSGEWGVGNGEWGMGSGLAALDLAVLDVDPEGG